MKNAEIKRRCRAIISAGNPIPQLDQQFLIDLFQLHPHAKRKIGAGIESVFVGRHASGFPGFLIQRVDNSIEEISHNKCIDKKSKIKSFVSTLRAAIGDDVMAFKRKMFADNFTVTCAVSLRELTYDEAVVDHGVRPFDFKSLVDKFVAIEKIDVESVEIIPGSSNGITFTKSQLKDNKLRERWIKFHVENAKLRIVGAKENMSQGRGRSHDDVA